jgi:hypothetical protein
MGSGGFGASLIEVFAIIFSEVSAYFWSLASIIKIMGTATARLIPANRSPRRQFMTARLPEAIADVLSATRKPAILNGPLNLSSHEQPVGLLPKGAVENSPGQAQRCPGLEAKLGTSALEGRIEYSHHKQMNPEKLHGFHTAPLGRESLGRTLSQGFTLGYFRPLPPGGTMPLTP